MKELFENLFNLLKLNLYDPLNQVLSENEIFNEFVNFINNLLVALFGNTSTITASNLIGLTTIIILILILMIIINLVLFIYNIFEDTFKEINLTKKRRRK